MAIPQYDVTIKGVALSTNGLTAWDTYDPFGLMTDGLVWSCHNVWFGPFNTTGTTLVTTSWSLVAAVSTSWTLSSGATVSTTWTPYSTNYVEDC